MKGSENRRGEQWHKGLTSMRPIGAILANVHILGLFRLITKSAEEPKDGAHFSSKRLN